MEPRLNCLSLRPFAPFLCNVCSKQSQPQIDATAFCSNCKLISYCGQSHQRADWKHHKYFCRAVNRLLTQRNVSHILDIGDAPIKGATTERLHATRALIKPALMLLLKRPLSNDEQEVQRRCLFIS